MRQQKRCESALTSHTHQTKHTHINQGKVVEEKKKQTKDKKEFKKLTPNSLFSIFILFLYILLEVTNAEDGRGAWVWW